MKHKIKDLVGKQIASEIKEKDNNIFKRKLLLEKKETSIFDIDEMIKVCLSKWYFSSLNDYNLPFSNIQSYDLNLPISNIQPSTPENISVNITVQNNPNI
jgi:hypothetical protein